MPEAMLFDAIRTPRGKGKKEGSLYEVKPITLLSSLRSFTYRLWDEQRGKLIGYRRLRELRRQQKRVARH